MAFLTEEVSSRTFTYTGSPPAEFDLSNKKFGASSITFDSTATSTWLGTQGNPVRLYEPTTTSLYGLTNYTISFWVNPTEGSTGTEVYIDQHNKSDWPSWFFRKYDSKIWLVAGDNGFIYTSSSYLTTGSWNHVAVVKQGSLYKMFINGITRATVTNASISYSQDLGYLSIGGGVDHGGTFHNFDGNIDEVHITNTVLWSSDFTLPTSPTISFGAETLFLAHFNEPQFHIAGITNENSRVLIFNEDTWALENSEAVVAGSYEIGVSDGTKTIVAIPDDVNITGLVHRNVTPIEE